MLFAVIGLDIEELKFTRVQVSHELVVANDDRADRRVIMTRVVVDDPGGGAYHLALVSVYENVTQTAPIDVFGERRLAAAQVVEGGQEVPLHDRHVALRTGFDAGTGNDSGDADAAFEDGTFPFLNNISMLPA